MSGHRLFTLLHKWITLLIGIQVVLWIAGGVVMSFFDIDKVRGSHNVREKEPQVINSEANLLSPSAVLAQNSMTATRMTTRFMVDRLVYEASIKDGTALFDAQSGEKLSPIDEETAISLAKNDFSGGDAIQNVELLEEAGYEYRGGPLPVWRIVFADDEGTRLYISANHGRVTARRNDTWRLFDFFWMLHIMDYSEREDFNHPLLIIASVIALFAALSGVVLYFYRFRRRDFSWVLPRKR
jgi:uncharacterized membrane protein YkoI